MNSTTVASIVIGAVGLAVATAALLLTRARSDLLGFVGASWKRLRRLLSGPGRFEAGTFASRHVIPKSFPEEELLPYEIGELRFPLIVLVGGDGTTTYEYPDGIVCSWSSKRYDMPPDLLQAYPDFLQRRKKAAEANRAVLENREHIRITDYSFGLRRPNEDPWPLQLELTTTNYFTTLATNYSMDQRLPCSQSLREKYCVDPRDLGNSVLSNPLAVNLSVVTSDKRILLGIRGRKVAINPAQGPGYTPAVSGTAEVTDKDDTGCYSPFVTARREAAEEVRSEMPTFESIRFFGLARTLRWQFPFLFGEMRLRDLTASQVKALLPRDHWETAGFVDLPFSPEAVIDFVRDVYRKTDREKITHSTIYAGLFSLLQSVRYEYPESWMDFVRELSTIETHTTV